MGRLLEREHGLRALHDALARARAGTGAVALVAGEAGIGKSALVSAFVTSLSNDVEAVTGACDALFTPRPLGPLRDIALQWNDEALLDESRERHAIFTLLLQRLRRRREPVVLVFEDMHWADEATLDLVRFLGRRIASVPALLVLTYRDDEAAGGHPLRAVLGDLPASLVERIRLEPLSAEAVATLARASEQDQRAGQLHALTDGNPFYVTELLASGTSEPSPSLRDAVLARANRLSPDAREALDVASLSPRGIEAWLLERCTSDAGAGIDACVTRGLLVTVPEGFAFRHELARLVVRDELSPLRRRGLGRKLMDALAAHPRAAATPARLAHFAEEAGEADAVVTYATEAARAAARLHSHREARDHFERH